MDVFLIMKSSKENVAAKPTSKTLIRLWVQCMTNSTEKQEVCMTFGKIFTETVPQYFYSYMVSR